MSDPGVVIGLGSLALINAGLAKAYNKKGFGGLFWFFATLFLGPIATFLIVAFKENENRN